MIFWADGFMKEALKRRSYAILIGCFSFLFGITIHSFLNFKINFFWLYNLLLVLAVLIILFWKNNKMRLIFLGVFFIVAGFARFDLSVRENKILPQYFGKDIKITGVISDEPISKMDKQQLVIQPEEIAGVKFRGQEKILVTANLYPEYFYGDKLLISCRLAAPKEFSDFNYAKWLTINDIYGLCYWPEVTRIYADENTVADTRGFMSALLSFKNFLISKVNNALHEPYASFLSGLILGARNSMPPDILENFRRTGTTHIIAISGWNISFLSWLFLPALFVLGIRRGKAFYIMLIFIAFYTLLVGASASVIRAALMGVALLLVQKTGRLNHAGRALLYAIVIMFLHNPRAIYDAGFWLSTAATFGLIYFTPVLICLLKSPSKAGPPRAEKSNFVNDYLVATITAIIFTLPISSYIFGSVSLWALPANLLIVPFVPVAFALSLAGLAASAFLPVYFASWALWPAAGVLNYIIHAAGSLSRLPGYSEWRMPFIIVVAYYGALLFFTFKKLKEIKETEQI